MRFSVLICTHNRSHLLGRALEALAQQEVSCNWEIIVVDNASRDRTAEVVRSFIARSPVQVRYLHEPLLGHSIALNTGIAAARGEFLAFTDDDACAETHWLQRMNAAFENYRADWVFGRVVPLWDGTPPRWFSPLFNGYFALLDYGPEPFVVCKPEHTFYGVNCAVRHRALQSLGGYREDLGPYGNRGGVGADTDLFGRALAMGMQIVYVPGVLVHHVISKARGTKRHQRRKVWVGTEDYYDWLRQSPPAVPWLLGLPRCLYRQAVDDLLGHATSRLVGDRTRAFHHELRVIRFLGLARQACRYGLRNPLLPSGRTSTIGG